ncbi:hypothetical protein CRL705_1906 [Latilactobacillus curvatus CRL 705]|nr:hypothetical protein CRL705_1906 [Latilactobacillus curvatus CRL 705]
MYMGMILSQILIKKRILRTPHVYGDDSDESAVPLEEA